MVNGPENRNGAANARERVVANPIQPGILLEFLGAAAGIAAFVTFVGGALLWLRFDELGLTADRAVSLLPREMLITVGAHALIVPAVAGLGAVIALYALPGWSRWVLALLALVIAFAGALLAQDILWDLSIGKGLIGNLVLAAAVAVPAAWGIDRLCEQILAKDWQPIVLTLAVMVVGGVAVIARVSNVPLWPHMVIIGLVTLAAAGAIFGTSMMRPAHRPVLWVVFLSFLLVGAAVSLARTAHEPKMEPVAVLLEKPSEQIAGFYVGEADGRIHIAQLPRASGLIGVSAEPVEAVISVSRDRVTRMAQRSPAGLGLADEGRGQAETLLQDLIVGQTPAGKTSSGPADSFKTDDRVWTFAPLLSIHSHEKISPQPVDYFLKGSRLWWSFKSCAPKARSNELESRVSWQELGEGDVVQSTQCRGGGPRYSSASYTRPYGKGRIGLEGREGFFLNLDNGLRKPKVRSTPEGSQKLLAKAPVYYERHDEFETPEDDDERITYWFFYPFSIPPGGNEKLGHEGDWERLSVLVRHGKDGRWTPLSVRYHEHDTHVDVLWPNVLKAPDETGVVSHPRAYVAKGSHATYRRAGKFPQVLSAGIEILEVKDDARACPDCPLWLTWRNLVDAEKEPWYGFGGAWGQVHESFSDFTGPLGPSCYKTLGLESQERPLSDICKGAGPVPR